MVERKKGERLSYAELDRRSNALAVGLGKEGVGRGDRVGVMLGNGVEYAVVSLFSRVEGGGESCEGG